MSRDIMESGSEPQARRTVPKNNKNTEYETANRLVVVGIGASAGGLESIERFLDRVDEVSGAAFVVIQHLSPDFKSFMPDILSKKTRLRVLTATDNMPVRPNAVYVIPPRMNLILENGVLWLTEIERSRIPNRPIDLFFESLANDVGDRAVAVVLSGTGRDGAQGIRKVNAAGGRVFIESPASAKFSEMPAASLAQRVHDGQGTPSEIADEIFGKKPDGVVSSARSLKAELEGDEERVRIFEAIERRYGVDFSCYKLATVNRRIDRRMTELNLTDIVDYWEFIEQNNIEVTTLYYEMLIGVTKFFRDSDAFALLRNSIAHIVSRKVDGDDIRVWSAGCASGEETYSLAMLFCEEITRAGKSLHLKVFATDIDDEILQRASSGLYRKDQMTDVPEAFLVKYFNEKHNRYKVTHELRSRVVFARHNILNDAPFSRLDLITCRNLLIYLNNDAQSQVLNSFQVSLNPEGALFLGPSESLGRYESGYETISRRWNIFSKSDSVGFKKDPESATRRQPQRDFPASARVAPQLGEDTVDSKFSVGIDSLDQVVVDQFVPPGLLINDDQELLRVYGSPPFGWAFDSDIPRQTLHSVLDQNLCVLISQCLQRAKQERVVIEQSGVFCVENGNERQVGITITPIVSNDGAAITCYLVSFSEPQGDSLNEPGQLENDAPTSSAFSALEEALDSTRQQLHSAHEELLTANEELHSVHEELYSVNADNQSKLAELNQLSIDEEHLFRSTGVGTLFIDRDHRIRKFTPMAAELFSLMAQDHGRPFVQASHDFVDINFNELIERCIRTQKIIETEVSTRSNEPYVVKIVPYQNDQKAPDGVVMSLVGSRAVGDAERLYKEMFQRSPMGILGLTPEQLIESVNRSLCDLLGYEDEQLLGRSLSTLFTTSKKDRVTQVVQAIGDDDVNHGNTERISSTIVRRDGSELPVEISVNSVSAASGRRIHLYVMDMTARQQYVDNIEWHRDQLEALVTQRTAELERRTEEYASLYENAPDMYASISAKDATIIKCNNRFAKKTGYKKSELLGKVIFELYHPDCHVDARRAFEQFVEVGSVRSKQLQLKSKTGEVIPVLLSAEADRDTDGTVTRSRSRWVDISDVYALKHENRTFLLATQGSDIGIWDWDFNSGRQLWSDKFLQLLGYDNANEKLSFDKPTIVHPNDKGGLTELFREHFAGTTGFDAEIRLQTANGSYRWFRLQGKAVRDDNGKVSRMVGSAQDVHAAREAQDKLRSQAEIHSFITQEANDGWWDWHVQTDYEYMSPRFWETFGFDPVSKLHSPEEWHTIIHPDDLNVVRDNFVRHSESGGEYPYLQEVRYKHAKGHWVTVLRRGRIIEWDKNNQPIRMVGVHTDVSRLKEQEQQLQEINAQLAKSNQDLEQFAYITSHDLKAPLRGISTLVGFVEEDLEGVLDDDSELSTGIRGHLRRLTHQATRMEALISGVLDYSRVDSVGAMVEDVNTRELLLDIAIDHQLEVGRQLNLANDLPTLRTDPIMFEQVLGNLISNAVKFHPKPEDLDIRIDCERIGERYEFSIADNGPGIDPKYHDRIFDMFQTLNSKDSYESTGIGLTLVKRIVEKFNGTVTVDSKEGQGSVFRFTWPSKIDDPVV